MAANTDPGTVVHLLGPPRIERDGEPVAPDTRKAIALLAYLVCEPRTHSRDHLATLLWPEADQQRARSALRRTLSALQGVLGGRGLEVGRESLAFTGDGVWVDVAGFRQAAAAPEGWAEAARLHGGGFLEGFALRDAPAFDDWQIQTAEELRAELAAVLARLVEASGPTAPAEALGYARRWVEVDPLQEAAHRSLMALHAAAGDRSAALQRYRACVALLDRELGVEPLQETTALYESIRDNTVVPAREAVPPAPEADRPLPLVGRDDALSALLSWCGGVTSDGRLAVIAGEPGIGKTRLASELIERLPGAQVVVARCHPEEQRLALGTCAELLRSAGSAIEDIVNEDDQGPAARRRQLSGLADALSGASGVRVLFVDDAQWIDASSLDVLAYLVRRMSGRPVVVLMTWRDEEVPPAHPLRRMLADASRAGAATCVVLSRLQPEDVEALARAMDAPPEVSAALYEETTGVPYFVAEYLRSPSPAGLSSGVRDLLSSRVERVSDVAVQVLAAAAVIGRAFDPDLIVRTSGRSEDEVAAALAELEGHGLLVTDMQRYDLSHPKLGAFVLEATTLLRRRILHRRAAEAVSRRARRHPELVALAAHHLERAGDDEAAADLYVEAGRFAQRVHANAEALDALRSALALGHPDATGLHEAIGDLLTLDGRYSEAIAAYEKAAALGGDLGALGHKLGGVHHRSGDWASADAYYVEALEALGSGPGRGRVLADRSLNAHRAGRHAEARALAVEALEAAGAEDDQRSLAQAHNISGIVAAHGGDAGSARSHLRASLDIAEELDDPSATAAALNNLAHALRKEGAGDAALLQARRAIDLVRRIGDRHREAALLSNIADILRDLGRRDEAMDHVKRSAAILSEVGEIGEPQPEVWKLTEW